MRPRENSPGAVSSHNAQQLLDVILSITNDGIFGVDADGCCTFVNDSAVALLGFSRERLLGREILDLVQPIPDEPRFVRADGTSFSALLVTYPWAAGGHVNGKICVFHDLTEKLRLDRELREAARRYRELFEYVTSGVYQTSPEGELLAVNPALIQLLGFESEHEIRAIDVSDLYVDRQQRAQCMQLLDRDGLLRNTILTLRRKDGSVIEVVENARVVRSEDGRVLYYEGTLNAA